MSDEALDFEAEEETAEVVELPPAIEKLQAKQALVGNHERNRGRHRVHRPH